MSQPSDTGDHPGSPERIENKAEAVETVTHPRAGIPEWKWTGAIAAFLLTSSISGYDVSNVANIQPVLYQAHGHIELLPWIGLSYSLANFAFLSFARKITYCFNLKWVYAAHLLIFLVGAVVAGAADNITAVIVGRIIMGWGGSVVQQTNFSYLAVFATTAESPSRFAMISAMWAVGLVVGGPIGSAFAENDSATWRWAFYLNVPLVGIALILAILCVPSHSLASSESVWKRIAKLDPIGVGFNLAVPILFAIATTFSGPIWAWGSGPSIAMWVIFGVTFIGWILQQTFCIFTTPKERAFPMHMLPRLDLLPLWVASGCAGAAYAVTLYYVPLFFAFARGHEALQQTVRLLPFILVFIVVVLFTGALMPKIGRYKIVYIFAGSFTLAGSAAMAATLDEDTSEAQVMGLEALIGIGLGMHFQHALGISNVINKRQNDRVDSAVICNMVQMGGIAVILAVAGCIFQNAGYNLLADAIGTDEYSEQDLREALAGVSSAVWQSRDPAILNSGIEAVTDVISREFYIVVASGALCLVCAICMRWEKLDYGAKPRKNSQPSDSDSA